ncbi:MAG: SGNH/GDSL hydrolase family protein [Bacteroidetes bacterium]|nr:SGNH/GDSL hydrolase family protein [Bacteroidota bacterium]
MFKKNNLLLLFASTAVSLLLGELVLRAIARPKEGFNHHQLYCEYDPLLGWRKVPNADGHHKTAEYEVVEHINSQGIRGLEYPLAKDSGEYRIMVLGDSFAEGYTVDFEDLFSEILKKKLHEKCPDQRYEVINTGTGGYSTDQEVLYFEQEGVQYWPDATVLLFCVNDPWFNLQSRYYDRGFKPRYVPSGDSLRLTNVPVPRLESRPFFSKTKDWLLANSELVRRLKNARDNLRYASDGQGVPDEWRIYQTATSPEMQDAWQRTAALLARLQQKTAAADSRLLVFYIPEKIEVHPDTWEDFLRTYSLGEQQVDATLPRRRLQAVCDSLQIPFIHPVLAFAEQVQADTSIRFYFKNDWHWNENGHRLAGEVLSAFFDCEIGR